MNKVLYILLLLVLPLLAQQQTIVLGGGCFWGVEKYFSHLKGVKDVKVGYAGGAYLNPTYKKILAHRKSTMVQNHAEVVKIVYDENMIRTEDILKAFWEMHDPTQGNRQGNDVGNNYRSIILYTTPQQKAIAFKTKEVYEKLLHQNGYGDITTEIKPLKKFYTAEDYHQDYLAKNPSGYCPNHATGVKFTKTKDKKHFIRPIGGKEIIVIESKNCPYCKQFKEDVLVNYHASLPLRSTTADKLKDFKLSTKIVATPTILFVQDGREKFAHVGYMDEKSFYKALGAFKLGKGSEAYDVAFHKSTERPYCKQYDIFKHTPDGVFVDKISGEILFDTRDRFNSGSGWLSFYKAVDDSVVAKEDNSYGMHRTEILSKKSGAHLGHLFHDAPNNKDRYCINATVLEFVKREDIKKWKEQWKKSH